MAGAARRRAVRELRELFWEWDPLGLAAERDLLPHEYDDEIERTLEWLEQGADAREVERDIVAWLRRARAAHSLSKAESVSAAETADRVHAWWQKLLITPPEDPEPPRWGSPWMRALLFVWLAVFAGSLAPGVDDVASVSADPLSLVASVASLAFSLLPVAAIVGAPRLAVGNPSLLSGSVLLVFSRAIPGLIDRLRLTYAFDPFEDPVRFTLAQSAVAVLQLSLTVIAAWLLVVGLRRLGAVPDLWAWWAILLAVGLVLSSYVAAFAAYGQPLVESVSANVPSFLWSFGIGLVGLFATAAMFVFAFAGVRAGLSPRPAWVMAALGFGAWLLLPVASTLGLIVGQAAPDLGGTWFAGYSLGRVADIALPVAFLAGLGGGGSIPPWVPWLLGQWRRLRGQSVVPAT